MEFQKQGCVLNVSLTADAAPAAGKEADLQVSLHFAGNYDVRALPRFEDIKSKNAWSSSASVSYRTRAAPYERW